MKKAQSSIDKSKEFLEKQLSSYTYEEALNIIKKQIQNILAYNNADVEITGLDFTGSRRFGNPKETSDLDLRMTYTGHEREDDVFNMLHDPAMPLILDNFDIDVNPIQDGDLDYFIEKDRKLDEVLGIDWSEVPEYNFDFAKEIFDCIDSFIDKDNINENFKSKRALRYHFNKHCLAGQQKKSEKFNVYYDFNNINDYRNYENKISSNANSSSVLTLHSLGDSEEVTKAFRKFFEGNKYLLLSTLCGFYNNNNSISILLYSFSSDVTTNYNQNTITLVVLRGNTTVTMYPIDANYLEQKLNNIIDKYCSTKNNVKFNHEALNINKSSKSLGDTKMKIRNSKNNLKEGRQQSAVKSNGVYSVLNNKWIKEPVQQDIPDFDKEAFDKLFNEWENKYFDLMDDISLEDLQENELEEDLDSISTKFSDTNSAKQAALIDLDDAKSIISDQLRGEWEAIKNYEKAVDDLKNINGDFKNVINILNAIADEEEAHVGELTTAKAEIDDAVLNNIANGQEEAEEKISETANELDYADPSEALQEEVKKIDKQINEINQYIEDIYDLRKKAIAEDGEYSLNNLIFKETRNKGYLDNLKDLRNKLIAKKLSLS